MEAYGAESIYDLLPPSNPPLKNQRMYRSKHEGTVDPKSFPLGEPKRAAGTFGPPKGLRTQPTEFLRKHAGEPVLPEPAYPTNPKLKVKAMVPGRDEKPVMGLVTNKNFVTANAVEVILAAPGKVPQDPPLATKKPDYGMVPAYLSTVKAKIDEERAMVTEYHSRMAAQLAPPGSVTVELPVEDKEALLGALKAKWEKTNAAYLKLSFSLDTVQKKQRKERFEAELAQIERDIALLGKHSVLVQEN